MTVEPLEDLMKSLDFMGKVVIVLMILVILLAIGFIGSMVYIVLSLPS